MDFPVIIHGSALKLSCEIPAGDIHWHVPEEVPIAVVYNRRNYAVMMGTPHDLTDFAAGFSLTEEVVKELSDIKSLDIFLSQQGVDLRFKITQSALDRLDVTQRRRHMVGSVSCGLCGLENADILFRRLPSVSNVRTQLNPAAMMQAMANLSQSQPLNAQTRSVHAAAWVTLAGEIKIVREDVGRHNAMDKLLGAIARANIKREDGFVLMSSRCSYEIVEKAARCGVLAILSISGPTAFALRKAKEANMAIYVRDGTGAVRLL